MHIRQMGHKASSSPFAVSVLEDAGPDGVEGLERPPLALDDCEPTPLLPLCLRSLERTAFFSRSS